MSTPLTPERIAALRRREYPMMNPEEFDALLDAAEENVRLREVLLAHREKLLGENQWIAEYFKSQPAETTPQMVEGALRSLDCWVDQWKLATVERDREKQRADDLAKQVATLVDASAALVAYVGPAPAGGLTNFGVLIESLRHAIATAPPVEPV